MKKLLAILLAVAMLVCFAGCGENGGDAAKVQSIDEVTLTTPSQIEKVAYDSKEEKENFIFGIGKYDDGGLISLLDLNAVVQDKENV